MLQIKKGVRIGGISPEMVIVAMVANGVYSRFNANAVITSCTEGTHSTFSRHYTGHALDFRTNNIPVGQHADLMNSMIAELGPDFNILLEGDHLHVGFKPRR